jgi:TPR repeat protein
MSEPAGQFGFDEGESGPATNAGLADAGPAETPSYPHCSRCHADITHCFLSARFCPRCGTTLAALPGETPPPLPIPPLPLRVLAIEPSESRVTHSLILGYANAMFRLGWRYENGHGTPRNCTEAVRCYFKAAKLGNGSALTRLTNRESDPSLAPDGLATDG